MEIDEVEFSAKSRPDKWSKMEILDYLIDSATNNHHPFFVATLFVPQNNSTMDRPHKLISAFISTVRHQPLAS